MQGRGDEIGKKKKSVQESVTKLATREKWK